jgi:putative endonuclease
VQTEKQIRGALGEQAAVDYLRRNGFMIVERNYRIGKSEVDIIASRYDEIHFVEVKTRKYGSMTAPEEAINEQKMRAMRRAASAYMAMCGCQLEPRFSLIAVEMIFSGWTLMFLAMASPRVATENQ